MSNDDAKHMYYILFHLQKVYVMRNPKDTFVSHIMLTKFLKQVDPDLNEEDFLDEYLAGKSNHLNMFSTISTKNNTGRHTYTYFNIHSDTTRSNSTYSSRIYAIREVTMREFGLPLYPISFAVISPDKQNVYEVTLRGVCITHFYLASYYITMTL